MSADAAFSITLVPPLDGERAVIVARDAILEAAEHIGWNTIDGDDRPSERQIIVQLADGVESNPHMPGILPTTEEQSYRVTSSDENDRTTTTVEADGVLGACFGLSAVADKIRANRAWPPADMDEVPRFAQRFTFLFIGFPDSDEAPYVDMDAAIAQLDGIVDTADASLLSGVTALHVLGSKFLFKWGNDRMDERAEACREIFREFLTAAHDRRMAVYLMDDEFLYEPEWFEKTGASFSVDDPKFWDALKSKYRDLLNDIPELDGIGTRTGEVTPHGDIQAWDLIHSPDDRSIEGNYRRFLKAMHEVVVGECDRLYLHRVWVVNTWEQSSVPEIYHRTFTSDIPTEKFISSIKITTGDQWQWQPINPTFGQSPHATCAQVETARAQDYFSGPPDFAVEFAQAGLEYALEHGSVASAVNITPRWGDSLVSGMNYVAFKLGWNPYQSVRDLTAEWAAAKFDPAIADRMAEMLLDFDDIYRDGFHIRGPAYHTWEPLLHVRTGFVCLGNPFLDDGRGHYRFLRDQYLQAKPELESGLRIMGDATARFEKWYEQYGRWLRELDDAECGVWLGETLQWGQDVLRLNLKYVTAFLRFFDYSDAARAGGDTRYLDKARRAVDALEDQLGAFNVSRMASSYRPNFTGAEQVQGINVFLGFARKGLDDLAGLITTMRSAPDDQGLRELFDRRRAEESELLAENPDAPTIVTWSGRIDGRDVLKFGLSDSTYVLDHYLGDPGAAESWTVTTPDGPGRPVVEVVRGGERSHVYILEEPGEANNNTLTVLIEDTTPGYGSHEFSVRWLAA
jgi:hypothetical protein